MDFQNYRSAIISILTIITLGLYFQPFRYVEIGEVQITRDSFTGDIGILNPGIHTVYPLTSTTTISTQTQRVCLSSDTHTAKNCRLVQFDVKYTTLFVQTEGFRWYWWSNRFSFNSGYDETYRGFRDVLRGYAFSSKQYPFVKILEE